MGFQAGADRCEVPWLAAVHCNCSSSALPHSPGYLPSLAKQPGWLAGQHSAQSLLLPVHTIGSARLPGWSSGHHLLALSLCCLQLEGCRREADALRARHAHELEQVDARVRAALARKDEAIAALQAQLESITQQLASGE